MRASGAPRRFSRPVPAAVDDGEMLRIRAGRDHRFTGVWVVVVDGRVFVPTRWIAPMPKNT